MVHGFDRGDMRARRLGGVIGAGSGSRASGILMRRGLLVPLAFMLLLCGALMCSIVRPAFADETADAVSTDGISAESSGGTFMLAVVSQDGTYIVNPTTVPYTSGQTVQAALQATDLAFVFNGDILSSVSGVTPKNGSYSYIYTDYGATSAFLGSVDASTITSLFISSDANVGDLGPGHCALLDALGAYAARTDGLHNYADAAAAYSAGLTGLPTSTSSAAQTLSDTLTEATGVYDGIMNGTRYPVNFDVTLNGSAVDDATITLTDTYGNVTTAVGGTASVVAGTYTYQALAASGLDAVRGSGLTVSAATAGQRIACELPAGSWLLDVNLLVNSDGKNNCSVLSGSVASRKISYAVPDIVKANADLYVNAHPGTSLSGMVSSYPLYAVYTGSDGNSYSQTVGWESSSFAPQYMVSPGTKGNEIDFEVRHYTDSTNAAYQVEMTKATLVRSPTLSALSVRDGSTECLDGFSAYTRSYDVYTSSSSLVIAPTAYGSADAGYSMTVAGQAVAAGSGVTVTTPTSTTPKAVAVKVALSNGTSTTYTVNIHRASEDSVTLTHDSDVTVTACNAAGSEMPATATTSTATTFSLLDGQTYTYTGTKGTWYHVSNAFTAASGTTIAVPTPKTDDWLSGLLLASNNNYTSASLYADESQTLHEHTFTVPDRYAVTYLRAIAANTSASLVYTVAHTSQVDGSDVTDTLSAYTNKTDGSKGAQGNLAYFQRMGGCSNTATLKVASTVSGSAGETYYQDYRIQTTRTLSLHKLAVSAGSSSLVMTQTATVGTDKPVTGYDSAVTDYTVGVPDGTSSIDVAYAFAKPSAATDVVAGGYTVTLDGVTQDYDATKSFSQTVALDTTKSTEDILVTVKHEGASDTVYKVTVNKLPQVSVRFTKTPAAANITLIEDLSGNRIMPAADGTFTLISGYSYTWSAACSGYVGKTGTFTASTGLTEDVTLAKAADNPDIDPTLKAEWPYFRADSNNNGVVSDPIPSSASTSVLYWASKLGSGYSATAAGCPILVDGYLYSYAGDQVMKVDTVTGKTVAQTTMAGTSSFAITPMTYAEGMVFVALSNGRVQAFDAKTLQSLWVYRSPDGGQPNCPITYWDGCVYTGFWNYGTKTDFVCLTITDEDPTSKTEAKTALWAYPHAGGFYWAGAYACNSFVLEGSNDAGIDDVLGMTGEDSASGTLFSFDPKTGAVIDSISDYPGGVHVGNIKSTVMYDGETGRYYYTTRGGYLCSVAMKADGSINHDTAWAVKLENMNASGAVSSTTTPVIYKGRAYVGADTGSYAGYAGQCVDVIDLATRTIAYKVPMAGRPQTSALVTTAYEGEDGYVYVYFFDNLTPGKLRYFKDKAGQTSAIMSTQETNTVNGVTTTYDVADVLFCPQQGQAQYCICSPICDEYGTVYFKNDSAYMMALGSTIAGIEVTQQPSKTTYATGDTFDPTGMKVVATYSNGKTRDITSYVSYSTDAFTTAGKKTVKITFPYTMYQASTADTDIGSAPDYNYTCPSTSVTVDVKGEIAPTITTETLPHATIPSPLTGYGDAYSVTLEAYGAPDEFTWAISSGKLPAGLALNKATGVISGKPVAGAGGLYTFTVTASNGVEPAASRTLTLQVDEKPTIATAGSLTAAIVGKAYSTTLAISSGYPTGVTWKLAPETALPAGLTLDSATGTISGVPTTPGTCSFKVCATNGIGVDSYRTFSIVTDAASRAPSITTTTLADAFIGKTYSMKLAGDGYPAPTWSWAAADGSSLPAGLTLDPATGTISGTPTVPGTYSLIVTAGNGVSPDATRTLTLAVYKAADGAPSITTDTLPAARQGEAYTGAVTVTGSPAPTVTVTGLPAGLTFDATTGTITGTPTETGSYSITVLATNGVKPDASATLSLEVDAAPAITTTSLPSTDDRSAYSAQLAATGYPAPVWSVTSGSLPAGLALDPATGTISGVATTDGTFTFTIQASNGIGKAVSKDLSIEVTAFWKRLAGGSRYGTAALIVDEGFTGTSDNVILARGDAFPDALAASSLAGTLHCPIITTPSTSLGPDAAAEIDRLKAKTVYLLGSTDSISQSTEDALKAKGLTVERIAGSSRIDTAVQVASLASEKGAKSDTCIITKGWAFADALAMAPYAYTSNSPIFLVNRDGSMPDEVTDAIRLGGFRNAIVLGGTDGITDLSMEALEKDTSVDTWIRLAGSSRYDTAELIAKWACGQTSTTDYLVQPTDETKLTYDGMAIARGDDFPDALASVDVLGPNRSAMLLVSSTATDEATRARIMRVIGGNRDSIGHGYILGGAGSVNTTVAEWARAAMVR